MQNLKTSMLEVSIFVLANFKVLLSYLYFDLKYDIQSFFKKLIRTKNVILDQNRTNTNSSIGFIISKQNKIKQNVTNHYIGNGLNIAIYEEFQTFKRFLNFGDILN